MNNLQELTKNYLDYCEFQKCLNKKTLKAYCIDLKQFCQRLSDTSVTDINTTLLENHIIYLHQTYQPKTTKRKIASLKAFFHYLEYRDIIDKNPFNKINIKFREPITLPKTIPLRTIEVFLSTIYKQRTKANTEHKKKNAIRDAAIIELLFATGMRISELCSLHTKDINLQDGIILIHGKGSKERRLQIGNKDVLQILNEYIDIYHTKSQKNSSHFFLNHIGNPVSDQAVRRMIKKYCKLAAIDLHITPHMFRHTFATSLLEADVDIRYIQEMLGHSSINITEIYTHVTLSKQREILANKHPRNGFTI